jgi:hypothetical protein
VSSQHSLLGGGGLADGIGVPKVPGIERPSPTAGGVLANGAEVLEVEVPRSDTVAWASCGGIPARTGCRSSEPAKWLVPTSRGGVQSISERKSKWDEGGVESSTN